MTGGQSGGETAMRAEPVHLSYFLWWWTRLTNEVRQESTWTPTFVDGIAMCSKQKTLRGGGAPWRKKKKEWKSYKEYRVTNLEPWEVWRKPVAACCHRWEPPSATVGLLPGHTAISLNAPSLEPVHDQACHRDNKTVIRSQRREVLQSASIMVSCDCELWPSSTGTDHTEEYSWHQGNQLVVALSPPLNPRAEEISPTYRFMLNNTTRSDCYEINHDKTWEGQAMSRFTQQITALNTIPSKKWGVHSSNNNFTK